MVGAMQALGYFTSDPACGLPIGNLGGMLVGWALLPESIT